MYVYTCEHIITPGKEREEGRDKKERGEEKRGREVGREGGRERITYSRYVHNSKERGVRLWGGWTHVHVATTIHVVRTCCKICKC